MLLTRAQSTFLNKMTHTESEAAAYEFTTLTVSTLDGCFIEGPN